MASFASTFPYFILIQPYLHSCHIRAHKTAFNISTFYVSYFHFLKCSSSKTRLLYSSFTFITYFHKWDILNDLSISISSYLPSSLFLVPFHVPGRQFSSTPFESLGNRSNILLQRSAPQRSCLGKELKGRVSQSFYSMLSLKTNEQIPFQGTTYFFWRQASKFCGKCF